MNVDICIISPSLLETATTRGGGCEVSDYNVALQLSKHHSIIILSTFYKKYQKQIKVNEGFYIKQIPIISPKNYPPKSNVESIILYLITWLSSFLIACNIFILKLRKKLKIIIVHNPETALVSTFLAKIMNIKTIYAEGNITPWYNPFIFEKKKSLLNKILDFFSSNLKILMCKNAVKIRTQSDSIKNGMIHSGINAKKIVVIPAGIDSNEFKPIKKIDRKLTRVGFIGRLNEIKGVPLLLEIVRTAEMELPDIKFLIFGDGHYKHCFESLSNIEHVGFITRDRLNAELAKVQTILSFQFELGRAEIEAMASGKAIIASNVGELPKKIKHLEEAILCDPNVQSYIDALKLLSKNNGLLVNISTNARELIISKYSWNIIGKEWLELYNELLNQS